jgi:hypothetical protein
LHTKDSGAIFLANDAIVHSITEFKNGNFTALDKNALVFLKKCGIELDTSTDDLKFLPLNKMQHQRISRFFPSPLLASGKRQIKRLLI